MADIYIYIYIYLLNSGSLFYIKDFAYNLSKCRTHAAMQVDLFWTEIERRIQWCVPIYISELVLLCGAQIHNYTRFICLQSFSKACKYHSYQCIVRVMQIVLVKLLYLYDLLKKKSIYNI